MGVTVNETAKLILSLSVSGGLFSLVLFALKPLIRNKLSKSFQYYIWIVVLLRFIVPLSFGINLSDFSLNAINEPQAVEETMILNNPINPVNVVSAVSNNAVNDNEPIVTEQQPSTPVSKESAEQLNVLRTLADNLMWIWLAGAVISVAWNIFGYLRFIRYVHSTAYAVEMPDCGVKVYKSRFAPTPTLIGVIKPRIFLPNIEYTDEQLNNIMLHELTHLRRCDVWLKWFATLVVSVHWFNPIAYFMRREFNRACELSCDEAVIRNLDGTEKQSYGDTLISVVAENRYHAGVMSVTMCEEKKKLKERLVAIMNYKKKTKITVFITIILTMMLTVSAFAFGASTGTNKQNPETENRNVTIISQNKEGIRFHIDKIKPNEVICLSKIELKNGVEYTLSMTAESGGTPFAALNESPNITSFQRIAWQQLKMNASLSPLTTTFYYIDMDVCYIYVGSISKTITNIDVVLTSDYTREETQDAEYDISLADLRQIAVKGDKLTFENFITYNGQDVLSGLYSMFFRIEGGYELLIAGGDPSEKPLYTRFSIPGVEENIDIRYNDINEFISKYYVPNELSSQIYGYLDTIISSPSYSSVTGDHIAAHLNEYAAIWNMGVTALPTLTGILDSDDRGLRSNIAVLLIKDIVVKESAKPSSEWLEGVLNSASRTIEQYAIGIVENNDNLKISDEKTEDDSYFFKGSITAKKFNYGNPFPAKKGDVVKISLAEELSGWQLDKDKISIRVVIGGNDGTTQEVILSNKDKEKEITIKENANHHVTIYNDNNQLVNCSIRLTINGKAITSNLTAISVDQFLSNAWNGDNSKTIDDKLENNSFLFKGGVAPNNHNYGNPFPAKKGDVVKISLAEELSGWQLDKDKISIKVVIGGNDGTTQEVILSNKDKEKTITIKENANHHVTIFNSNNQLVNYSILFTINEKH